MFESKGYYPFRAGAASPLQLLQEEIKAKADPLSLGSSTSSETPENPFAKILQAQETKPNPSSLNAEPAISAILATTQEPAKAPVEAEPKTEKVESLKKAVTPRPKHAESSEPWRKFFCGQEANAAAQAIFFCAIRP